MGMTEFAEMMAKKYGIRKPETAPAAPPPGRGAEQDGKRTVIFPD